MPFARPAWILLLGVGLSTGAPEAPRASSGAPGAPAGASRPGIAGVPAPRPARAVIRERWTEWFGGKHRIAATDLDDEAADPAVCGEPAAAVAALLQELTRLKAKESVDGIDREALFPAEGQGDAAMWKRIEANYRMSLRKCRALPTELWAGGGPTLDAVRQAREGDCWLLAATGWMVRSRPEAVRRAIEPAGDGRWRVRFANGESVEVSTPTTVELIAVNSEATLKGGLWLPIVKEAMGEIIAKTNGRKAEIEAESLRINGGSGARMLQRWTGHRVRTIRLEGKTPVEDVRKAIADGVARNAAMGAGTPKEPKGKIPPNHAMAIFGFDAATDEVITWNPWGNDFAPKGEPGRENGWPRTAGISRIPVVELSDLFRGLWIETDEPASGAAAPGRTGP